MDKPLTVQNVQAWLNRYVDAWRANDPALIGALFSEDVVYHADPFGDPLRGRQAIVDAWLGEEMPTSFRTEYRPELVDGTRVFASGQTEYFNKDGSRHSFWANAFLLWFDDAGRCREYREWYMKKRA
jgi:ketosteroid isomerase-like protein